MWLDNLNRMKKISNKTLEEISTESGIPKGTLNKLFSGQTKDPQLSTIKSVVHSLGYTLDDLSNDDFEIHNQNIDINLTEKYNQLPLPDRKIVDEIIYAMIIKNQVLESEQANPKESS